MHITMLELISHHFLNDCQTKKTKTLFGCELRSGVILERARNADQKLTRFLTGRRFVFITVPTTPLDRTLQVNVFKATVYHREQKLARKPVTCSKCLEKGHHVSACTNDTVCIVCRCPGHKRGDPQCNLFVSDHTEKTDKTGTSKEDRNEEEGSDRNDDRDE